MTSSKRVPELDGIRGIAILLVVIWHFLPMPSRHDASSYFVNRLIVALGGLAWSGVDLFFVLSGFLIGGILLDNRDATNYFRVFYLRRLVRIFPLYYILLACYGAVVIASQYGLLSTLQGLLTQRLPFWPYPLFLQNFYVAALDKPGDLILNPTWSLAVEEQFYLLLPLLVRLLPRRALPYVLASGFLAAPMIRTLLTLTTSTARSSTYVLLPCRADALFAGVLCAWALRQDGLKSAIERHSRWLYPPLLLFILVTLWMSVYKRTMGTFTMMTWGYTWLALMYTCVLLIAVSERRGLVSALARFAPLRWLGIRAYGLYLMNLPALLITFSFAIGRGPRVRDLTDALLLSLSLFITLGLAHTVWHLVEKPLIAWGHRFHYANRHREADARDHPEACASGGNGPG